jgi:hypothetical protein
MVEGAEEMEKGENLGLLQIQRGTAAAAPQGGPIECKCVERTCIPTGGGGVNNRKGKKSRYKTNGWLEYEFDAQNGFWGTWELEWCFVDCETSMKAGSWDCKGFSFAFFDGRKPSWDKSKEHYKAIPWDNQHPDCAGVADDNDNFAALELKQLPHVGIPTWESDVQRYMRYCDGYGFQGFQPHPCRKKEVEVLSFGPAGNRRRDYRIAGHYKLPMDEQLCPWLRGEIKNKFGRPLTQIFGRDSQPVTESDRKVICAGGFHTEGIGKEVVRTHCTKTCCPYKNLDPYRTVGPEYFPYS